VTGETVDILEYLDFGLYDHVSSKENAGLKVTSIGRWLGVSHRVGGLMSYWVLTMRGTVISRTSVTAMPVRPPFRYCSQAMAYVSITPFVGVIGQEVTRDSLIREKGHQR
jgi:hypothetical protein